MTRALDFVVIGAQKGGTTALFELLRQHPDLCLPADKEAPFFNRPELYSRGVDVPFASVRTARLRAFWGRNDRYPWGRTVEDHDTR